MHFAQSIHIERALRWLSLFTVLALVVFLVVVQPVDMAELWHTLKNLPASLWPELVALTLLCYGLRFARWQGFVAVLGTRVPLVHHVFVYLAGFVSALTVGKAGETIRAVYLRPFGLGYVDCMGVCFVDRLLDLVGVALLAGLAFGMLGDKAPWAWSALGLCLVVMLLFRSRVLVFLAARLPIRRLSGLASDGLRTTSRLLTGFSLLRGLGLSLLAWIVQGLCLHFTLLAMGHSMIWYEVVGIYAVSLLAGAATFLPGGFGASEAAITWLLSMKGVPSSVALAAALVGRGVPQWLGLAMAAASMGRLSMGWKLPAQPDENLSMLLEGEAPAPSSSGSVRRL
jgi:glycosyltransferase 2 family protein